MTRYRSALTVVVVIVASVGLATDAFAAKATSATLFVSLTTAPTATINGSSVPYATPYVVSGCGYDVANGGVTVVVHSPEAISFAGQVPDSNGCISVSNFSTQGAGSYEVDAYQKLHNKSSLMASTAFTLK